MADVDDYELHRRPAPGHSRLSQEKSYVQLLLRTTSRNGLLHKTMNMNPPPPEIREAACGGCVQQDGRPDHKT